jgi:hypothetical protein
MNSSGDWGMCGVNVCRYTKAQIMISLPDLYKDGDS